MQIDRVLANNPGPFTGPGTNTWVLGDGSGSVVVIDPGPVDPHHADAVMDVVGGRGVGAVLVTHTHVDHAPMANPLAGELEVPALGHGPGPEFDPDVRLDDGSVFVIGSLPLQVIHTPGHSDDHLCFRAEDALFTGDHIMGGSSVVVEKMGPYLASLEKLKGEGITRIHPGHGDEMDDPDAVVDWYLAHRRQRHRQILSSVRTGSHSVPEIVEVVYTDVDPSLHSLAAISVRAHLALLAEEGRIALHGDRVAAVPEAQ